MDVSITLIPRPIVDKEMLTRLKPAAELVYDNFAAKRRCMDCRVRHFTGGLLCEECLAAKRAGFIRVPVKPFTSATKRNAITLRRSTVRPVARIA